MPAVALICGLVAAASPLPAYRPQAAVSGTIRIFGSGLGGLVKLWEQEFVKLQPAVRFDDHLPTSDAAIPALVTGVADLAPDGGEATLTETLALYEVHGHPPVDIVVATGSFDVEGHSNGLVIFVHKDNPLERLTVAQVDRI